MQGKNQEEQVTLHGLFVYMKGLDERLREHMQQEERGMKDIHAEIKKVGEKVDTVCVEVKQLFDAMPEDEHGRYDTFGHKIDHKEYRERRKEIQETRKTAKDTVIDFIVRGGLTAAVLLILGEKIVAMFKG